MTKTVITRIMLDADEDDQQAFVSGLKGKKT